MDETTVEETTTTDGTTTADAGSFDFADEDCRALVAAFVSVSTAFAGAVTGAAPDFSGELEGFSELAESVPDEIRADVEILAAAYEEYVDVVREAGIEAGAIPTAEQAQQLQEALRDVGREDVSAAGERLSSWTNENCTG